MNKTLIHCKNVLSQSTCNRTFSCVIHSAFLSVQKFYINHQDNLLRLTEATTGEAQPPVHMTLLSRPNLQFTSGFIRTEPFGSSTLPSRFTVALHEERKTVARSSRNECWTNSVGRVWLSMFSVSVIDAVVAFKCLPWLGFGDSAVYPRLALTS